MIEQETRIGCLRVRGGQRDDPALRLGLAALLDQAALRPRGLPPAAVLIVRRLADPLPHRLHLQGGLPVMDPAWEQAVQEALTAQVRRAARPAPGLFPDSAEAVLFTDFADLLACLAIDLIQGRAEQRWWWRALLRQVAPGPRSERLRALLCAHAVYVPAALHHLSEREQVVPVLRALAPPDAVAVLAALAAAAGLPDLGLAGEEGREVQHGREAPASPQAGEPAPPWERVLLPEAVAAMGRAQRGVLGLGLMLHHAPARVRTQAFQQQFRRWWHAAGASAREEARAAPSPDLHAAHAFPGRVKPSEPRVTSGERPPRPSRGASDGGDAALQAKEGPSMQRPAAPEVRRPEGASSGAAPQGKDRAPRHEAPAAATLPDPSPNVEAGSPVGLPPRPAARPQRVEAAVLGWNDGVHTRLGGVLYLLNLMMYLDLPACFEDDWKLGSEVGPWGVLEVLGRALLGPEQGHLRADPLWDALAALDGRPPGTLPGAHLQGCGRLLLPEAWLTELAQGAEPLFEGAVAGGRLYLWTGTCLVADLPCDQGSLEEQVRAVLAACGPDHAARKWQPRPPAAVPVAPLSSPWLDGLNPALGWWLSRVLPYLRHRLCTALGLEDHTALAETLLLHAGRLYLTSSHVDLVLPLESIALNVRLAALDRNPGWLPAFGRVVLFHFE